MEKVLRTAESWAAPMAAEDATQIDEKQYQRILRLAARIAGPQEAPDIAQRAFLLALKSLPTFRRKAKFSTWLTRIATNVAISTRRRVSKRRALFPNGSTCRDVAAVATLCANPRKQAENSENRKIVQEAIDCLPSKLLVPFVLRYYEGMTCREVAQMLGRPEGTVRYRVFKARQVLKEKLKRVLK